MLTNSASAQPSKDVQIQAVMITKFLSFVQIPELLKEKQIICVFGDSPLASELIELSRIDPKLKAPLILSHGQNFESCALVFLDEHLSSNYLQELKTKTLITVSDSGGFADEGGIVEIVRLNGKMGFVISEIAASKVGIKFSSLLLSLAKRVIT